MDAEALKALQAPLKAKYREDPASALVTMRARATVEGDDIACKLDIDRASARAGLHPAAGGSGEDLSRRHAAGSVVGCAGVTLKAVATAMGIAIDRAQIVAEGDWRFPRHPRRRQGGAGGVQRYPSEVRYCFVSARPIRSHSLSSWPNATAWSIRR